LSAEIPELWGSVHWGFPVAILAASDNPEAEAFEQFLASKKGQAIFARFGFGIAK